MNALIAVISMMCILSSCGKDIYNMEPVSTYEYITTEQATVTEQTEEATDASTDSDADKIKESDDDGADKGLSDKKDTEEPEADNTEKTADSKTEEAGNKEKTADSNKEETDKNKEISDSKKEEADSKEVSDSSKEEADNKEISNNKNETTEEVYEYINEDGKRMSNDSSGFVLISEAVPDAILEIRYYSTYNFVGDRIDGYEEPVAIITKEAAEALREVSDELVAQGYRLKIYDAYRPQPAVSHFVRWAEDIDDTRMKEYFYPELDKSVLFNQGYISEYSGHSRGSSVDLTLFDMRTEKEVDMGGTFDYFGENSHPDYTGITTEQYENRMILRNAMTAHGFKPISVEWWHFNYINEPYPDTYFTFPVSSDSVEHVTE